MQVKSEQADKSKMQFANKVRFRQGQTTGNEKAMQTLKNQGIKTQTRGLTMSDNTTTPRNKTKGLIRVQRDRGDN